MAGHSRFLTSALIYAGTSAIASGVPFFLLPILTRVLTPEEYGLAALFLLAVNFLTHFAGVGLSGATVVRYFDKDTDFPTFVSACLRITAATTILTLLVVLALSPWVSPLLELSREWLLVAVISAGANAVILLRLTIWQAKRQPVYFGIYRIMNSISDISLSLFLVLALSYGWEGRAGGVAFSLLATATIGLLLMWRDGYATAAAGQSAYRDALGFGLPLIPHLVGGFLLMLADRIIIANVINVHAVGIYMTAAQIGLVLNLITTSINRAFSPWLMKNLSMADPSRDRRLVGATYIYCASLFAVAAIFSWLAVLALPSIAGPAFAEAAPIIPYVVMGTAFTGAYFMVTNYIFFKSRTGLLSGATLTTGLVSLFISYSMVSSFGVIGAGYAFLISQFILFAVTWFIASRVHAMPWGKPDFNVLKMGD